MSVERDSVGLVIARSRGSRFTQEGLASAVGCSTAMIAKIESGSRAPSPKLTLRLAKQLGLDEAHLEALAAEARPKNKGSALVEAFKIGRENAANAQQVRHRLRGMQEGAKTAAEALAQLGVRAVDGPAALFARVISVVVEIPQTFLADDSETATRRSKDESVQSAFARSQRETRSGFGALIGAGASSLGAGGVFGAATGMGAYAAVASFATASTGAAISGLSGAAATSATLAWFGGGALAAGGAGVAGGTLVLTSVITLPLLAFATTVAIAQGSQILAKQEKHRDKLGLVLEEVDANERVVQTFVDRVGRIASVVQVAERKAALAVHVLEESPQLKAAIDMPARGIDTDDAMPALEHVNFSTLDRRQASALESLAFVVASLGTLLTLPLGLRLREDTALAKLGDDEEENESRGRLDPGLPEENEYIDYAIDELLAQVATA